MFSGPCSHSGAHGTLDPFAHGSKVGFKVKIVQKSHGKCGLGTPWAFVLDKGLSSFWEGPLCPSIPLTCPEGRWDSLCSLSREWGRGGALTGCREQAMLGCGSPVLGSRWADGPCSDPCPHCTAWSSTWSSTQRSESTSVTSVPRPSTGSPTSSATRCPTTAASASNVKTA